MDRKCSGKSFLAFIGRINLSHALDHALDLDHALRG